MKQLRKKIISFVRKKTNVYKLVLVIIALYAITFVVRDLARSMFLVPKDRVNLVLYGEKTVIYSIGVGDSGDYAIVFYPNMKVRVPESYGHYRVGSLGKLVYLEKKPEILQKAFSIDLSTFIDYYFFQNTDVLYYGDSTEDKAIVKPNIIRVLFSFSNASFSNKVYISLLLMNKTNKDFQVIRYLSFDEIQGDRVFSPQEFVRRYEGIFFQSTYREENKNVQVVYTGRYKNAFYLSSILGGSGIRVSDITRKKEEEVDYEGCIVVENTNAHSRTARQIASYFGCGMEKGETDIYDILFVLAGLEDTWNLK